MMGINFLRGRGGGFDQRGRGRGPMNLRRGGMESIMVERDRGGSWSPMPRSTDMRSRGRGFINGMGSSRNEAKQLPSLMSQPFLPPRELISTPRSRYEYDSASYEYDSYESAQEYDYKPVRAADYEYEEPIYENEYDYDEPMQTDYDYEYDESYDLAQPDYEYDYEYDHESSRPQIVRPRMVPLPRPRMAPLPRPRMAPLPRQRIAPLARPRMAHIPPTRMAPLPPTPGMMSPRRPMLPYPRLARPMMLPGVTTPRLRFPGRGRGRGSGKIIRPSARQQEQKPKPKPKVKKNKPKDTAGELSFEINKPWINEAMKNEILKKHKLHQKVRKLGKDAQEKDKDAWEAFKEQRNKVTTMIREAKLEYIGNHPEEDVEKILAEANSAAREKASAMPYIIDEESSDNEETGAENNQLNAGEEGSTGNNQVNAGEEASTVDNQPSVGEEASTVDNQPSVGEEAGTGDNQLNAGDESAQP